MTFARRLGIILVAVVVPACGSCADAPTERTWTNAVAPMPDGGHDVADPPPRATITARASRSGQHSPGAILTTRPVVDSGPGAPGGNTPTDELLDQLADCESRRNPQAISRNGLYYGAFQWALRSWDHHVARMGRGDLVGVDPRTLPYEQQRDITRAVPLTAWRDQFPTCARTLGLAR